jgi:hypothetical protein
MRELVIQEEVIVDDEGTRDPYIGQVVDANDEEVIVSPANRADIPEEIAIPREDITLLDELVGDTTISQERIEEAMRSVLQEAAETQRSRNQRHFQ